MNGALCAGCARETRHARRPPRHPQPAEEATPRRPSRARSAYDRRHACHARRTRPAPHRGSGAARRDGRWPCMSRTPTADQRTRACAAPPSARRSNRLPNASPPSRTWTALARHPVVRVDVSGDQPFFLQSGKHCGDAAGAGLQRTGELRRRHGAAQCELVQNEWLAMRTARELLLHLGTVAPHAGVQFAERLPLKTHFAPPSDSTIAALPRSAEYRQYIPAAYTSCKHL